MILMYNIMILFNSVTIFSQLGLFAQNELQSESYDSEMNEQNLSTLAFVLYLTVLLTFYVIAVIVTFMFYKQ